MTEPPRLRPSLAWLGLAAAVALAGVAGAAILLVLLIRGTDGPFVALDDTVTVRLAEGEGRGIWAYREGGGDGECFALGPGRVTMRDTHGVRITRGGRTYHSFLRFEAPRDGVYRVGCSSTEPLALGPQLTGLRVFAGVAGILGSLFGGLLGAGAIVGVVLILRERSKRRWETGG